MSHDEKTTETRVDLDSKCIDTIRTAGRFVAYGWNVTSVADANDLKQIEDAFHDFRPSTSGPTLIVVHSHIGLAARGA